MEIKQVKAGCRVCWQSCSIELTCALRGGTSVGSAQSRLADGHGLTSGTGTCAEWKGAPGSLGLGREAGFCRARAQVCQHGDWPYCNTVTVTRPAEFDERFKSQSELGTAS